MIWKHVKIANHQIANLDFWFFTISFLPGFSTDAMFLGISESSILVLLKLLLLIYTMWPYLCWRNECFLVPIYLTLNGTSNILVCENLVSWTMSFKIVLSKTIAWRARKDLDSGENHAFLHSASVDKSAWQHWW